MADRAHDALDGRLNPAASTPIAVAYSGGGDSLMALKLTKAWADRHGRAVIAFSVDHRLQPASSQWIDTARHTAERLGVAFQPLAWTGDKPATGLPAAARQARHRLIADAARSVGARVVVFGHTADDGLEAEVMREEGLRLGYLREWSPSPVWPEGRGLFLLRPLLSLRRADIREILCGEGEAWIDDPANIDPRSPRARARMSLTGGSSHCESLNRSDDEATIALARMAAIGEDSAIRFHRQTLRDASPGARLRVLSAALTCSGGQPGPPRGVRLRTLADRLLTAEPVTATLCGAKILAGETVLIVRDAGERRRGGLATVIAPQGRSVIWDGRFEITAGLSPITVGALAGRMTSLSDKDLARLKALDPAIRPSLPFIVADDPRPTCPILAQTRSAHVRSLVKERFLAACGVFSKEGAT